MGMRMNTKLILLFSMMTLFTVTANSIYFLQLEMKALRDSIADNLTAVGRKMVSEIEQYVQTMNFAIENMASNTQFMESMHQLCLQGDDADVVSAQTMLSQDLFNSQINRRFYRVSLFTRSGLFMSNQFESTGMAQSLSDEAREIVASLTWLAGVESDVYRSHIIPLRHDPWNTAGRVEVFSAVRAAVWRGRTIGYLEVTAHADDLERIFSVPAMEGVVVRAVFDNGDILYSSPDGASDIIADGISGDPQATGAGLPVVAAYSKTLGLRVYISQDSAVQDRLARALITRYISTGGIILAVAAILIALFSFRLTNSIRRLTKKVRAISASDMLRPDAPAVTSTVTSPKDLEIRELESVFNELTRRLRASMNNELDMRQATLHAQLNALQAQINPHFIYNTLNIISAKGMESDNEEIVDICSQLARMLRYSTNMQSSAVTIMDELDHTRSYLNLVKARYEGRLSYNIGIPDDARSLPIPRLILQPLVENTIKHGYNYSIHSIHIDIRGVFADGWFCLTIRDNGQGFSDRALSQINAAFEEINDRVTYDQEKAAEHIGLANTYMRLSYFSGKRIPMKLYNDAGAVIELSIPDRKRVVE
ncbi:MAG: histidine kinase [Oscillospiraceae bacterium]|nr:histidine kinase [Oscillospiraceae bacterium]